MQQQLTKHTRSSKILQILNQDCCVHKCLGLFSCREVKNMRTKYWSKKPQERHQWIFDKFMEQADIHKNAKFITERGIAVCQNAFMGIFDINKSVYYRKRKSFLSGANSASSFKFRQRTTKYLSAMNWFETYVSFHGDRMPHCNTVFLPYRTRKFVIFKQYSHEVDPNNAVKRSTFYRMWSSSFPNVKIKEVCIHKDS